MRKLLVAMLVSAMFAVPSFARPELAEGAEPVAVAEAMVAGDTVTLSGKDSSAIDPTYLWTQVKGPAVAIVNADQCDATVTGAAPGTYSFELTVVDASGSASDTVSFTVNPKAQVVLYNIVNSIGSNGTVTLNGSALPAGGSTTMVTAGQNCVYAFTPDSGYVVSDVVVDGTDLGAIAAYSLLNVSASHTLTVTFAAAPAPTPAPAHHSGGGGGGGGGGCSMVVAGDASVLGWAVPYASLALYWLVMRRREAVGGRR